MIEHILLDDEPNGEHEFREALSEAIEAWGSDRVTWLYDEQLHGYRLKYPREIELGVRERLKTR